MNNTGSGLGTQLAPLQHARPRTKAKHAFYGMPGSQRLTFGLQPTERARWLKAWATATAALSRTLKRGTRS